MNCNHAAVSEPESSKLEPVLIPRDPVGLRSTFDMVQNGVYSWRYPLIFSARRGILRSVVGNVGNRTCDFFRHPGCGATRVAAARWRLASRGDVVRGAAVLVEVAVLVAMIAHVTSVTPPQQSAYRAVVGQVVAQGPDVVVVAYTLTNTGKRATTPVCDITIRNSSGVALGTATYPWTRSLRPGQSVSVDSALVYVTPVTTESSESATVQCA
jgi:hypothetical protein